MSLRFAVLGVLASFSALAVADEEPADGARSTGTFTDLETAPECAMVTVYPAKIVTDPGAAGIPIHDGRCLTARFSKVERVGMRGNGSAAAGPGTLSHFGREAAQAGENRASDKILYLRL